MRDVFDQTPEEQFKGVPPGWQEVHVGDVLQDIPSLEIPRVHESFEGRE
jgi:hypothetical protein